MKKKLFGFNTKTLVGTALGAALFTVLFMYVKIPTGIPETASNLRSDDHKLHY